MFDWLGIPTEVETGGVTQFGIPGVLILAVIVILLFSPLE
jgi:hypothetical protein